MDLEDDGQNSCPLAPEKNVLQNKQMSGYQKRLITDLNLNPPNSEMLVLTLEDKQKYMVHYKCSFSPDRACV